MQVKRVILDINDIYRELANHARAHTERYGALPNDFCNDALANVLEYVCDGREALNNIAELAEDTRSAISDTVSDEDVAMVMASAVYVFGVKLFYYLRNVGVYTEDNLMWFQFGGFLGQDLMLIPMKKEDFIN